MPKGVMWRQDSLIKAVSSSQNARLLDVDADYEALAGDIAAPGVSLIPACPEMHGTGQFTAQLALCGGGSNVLLPGRHFDVAELLDTIEEKKVQAVTIVGDAFAKPILAALDAEPDRWDISSLFLITSSGVMWSQESKSGLLRHNANMMLIDAFSSSEAIGLGQSVSTAQGSSGTAKFMLGANSRVITDDGADVEPGSGQIGRVAVRGFTPIGYYKDEAKSAATFVRIGDDTYSIPGDYAMVEADGSLTLLGRGSVVINTAGEKVFPEEVEEVCKLHPSVADAVAVGIPDDKFGEAVTAVVELHGDTALEPDELVDHVKQRHAAYKAPRNVVIIDTIGRAANGKVDYKRLKGFAADQLGVTLPS
jgi:fatty-acyl-CoA synthase